MDSPSLDYINRLSNGDEGVFNTLITVIKKEFPIHKEEYFSSVEAKELRVVEEHVHRLKHKISVFGMNDSYELANQYEKNLRAGSFELKEEFESILMTITKYIETL